MCTTLAHTQAAPPSFIMETLGSQHASYTGPTGLTVLPVVDPPQGMRSPWESWLQAASSIPATVESHWVHVWSYWSCCFRTASHTGKPIWSTGMGGPRVAQAKEGRLWGQQSEGTTQRAREWTCEVAKQPETAGSALHRGGLQSQTQRGAIFLATAGSMSFHAHLEAQRGALCGLGCSV